MNEFNNWHPMPRYGLAATLVHLSKQPALVQDLDLFECAVQTLKAGLSAFVLAPHPMNTPQLIRFSYLSATDVDPGSKSGQVSANGFYTGPQITTSNNAAYLLKEVKALIVNLEQKDAKPFELKRSFAPMIAKLNAGKASMSNPKVDLLHAAFTAIATLTKLKPAAFDGNNTGLIPDLPFYDEISQSFPLYEFILLFEQMQREGLGEDAYLSEMNGKAYRRPPVFQGNYPNAPKATSFGILPLVSAIGKWVEKQERLFDQAKSALSWLESRPIYIISDRGTAQERFGHHLVELSLSGALHLVLRQTSRVSLIGLEDGKKFSDNKWKLFLRYFDQFLRFFTPSSFQNFLSTRAVYPAEFFTLLKSYFMQEGKYDEQLINAAVAYGQSLNAAAYWAAKREAEEDRQNDFSGKGLKENKHRVLLQLESIVQSAKTGAELIARLNAQAGRLTMQDVPQDAQPFLVAVVNAQIPIDDARNLITAFMRLSSYRAKDNFEDTDDVAAALSDESVLDD